jgi:hypothetical protein
MQQALKAIDIFSELINITCMLKIAITSIIIFIKTINSSIFYCSCLFQNPTMGPPGPLRSDGCPDMRYSCNRSWASSSGSSVPLSTGGFYSSTGRSSIGGSSACPASSSSTAPRQSSLQLRAVAENAPARLRADGLPDMRYAANKSYVAERNMEIPLTTTSRRNSTAASASKTTSQTSTSGTGKHLLFLL